MTTKPLNEYTSDDIDRVIDALPHGSGIDGGWIGEQKPGGNIVCSNSYHVMDEYGGYCGWQDFKVILFTVKADKFVDLKGPCAGQRQRIATKGATDWKLQSVGGWRRDSAAYGIKDYLEETIQYALSEAGIIDTDMPIINAQGEKAGV